MNPSLTLSLISRSVAGIALALTPRWMVAG
jgi:hypothetical protein